MFFTARQIAYSITVLRKHVHPFFGITFLVCKRHELPVGNTIVFPLDAETKKFMQEYHRIDSRSDYFYQPFKSIAHWLRPDYPANGLQSINTQTFAIVFLHKTGSREWGWELDYIEKLKKKINRKKLPTFDLAVWLYREREWPDNITSQAVINQFFEDFKINSEEQSTLFEIALQSDIDHNAIFQVSKTDWRELGLPKAPDVDPDEGGTLAYLETRRLGPAEIFQFEPAKRLNIITGDNGLGKSFLLETAWWALTGTWTEQPLHPGQDRSIIHEQAPTQNKQPVEIIFEIASEQSTFPREHIVYDWKSLSWPQLDKRPVIAGLIVYARVDGSYAVWDPVGQKSHNQVNNKSIAITREEVFWGGASPGRIRGLVLDWVIWQSNPKRYACYEIFKAVLKCFSPSDLGELKPGEPTRIPGNSYDIPTIIHPYGEVPIVYASAGVRRIVTLAYFIVWAWQEHLTASEMSGLTPQRRMVIMIDELEAHLHPFWQRAILPALMEVGGILSNSLKQTTDVQYILSTHSPLVMASAETVFESDKDKLFHLDALATGEVVLNQLDFFRYGDAATWLMSETFDQMKSGGRSKMAEQALEEAAIAMSDKSFSKAQAKGLHNKLLGLLGDTDPFWVRWRFIAEKKGWLK